MSVDISYIFSIAVTKSLYFLHALLSVKITYLLYSPTLKKRSYYQILVTNKPHIIFGFYNFYDIEYRFFFLWHSLRLKIIKLVLYY